MLVGTEWGSTSCVQPAPRTDVDAAAVETITNECAAGEPGVRSCDVEHRWRARCSWDASTGV